MGNPGHVQPYGQLPWPHSQHLLIQVDVQGPVRVIGIFVVLVTGQGVLRDNRNAVEPGVGRDISWDLNDQNNVHRQAQD